MFNVDRRIYIIRKANGKVYKIGCTSDILTMCSLYREKIWSDPFAPVVKYRESFWTEEIVLMRDIHPYFSAYIDKRDNIHLLCSSKAGDLACISLNNNIDRHMQIIGCASSDGINSRYPEIFGAGDKTALCYMTGKLHDRKITMHMQEYDGALSERQITDSAQGGKKPFIIVNDVSQSPYLFYKKEDGAALVAGYRKYMEDSDSWSDFQPVCRCGINNNILSAAIDYKNNIYLIRQINKGRNYDIICTVKFTNRNEYVDCSVFSGSDYPFDNSSILTVENRILIYWVRGNNIFYCLSIDGGYTWDKPRAYEFPDISPLHCISYKSNNPGEYPSSCINLLPGRITNLFRLAFINELCPGRENIILDEMRALFCSFIRQHSFELEQVANSITDIDKRLTDLEMRLDSLEEKFHNDAEKRKTDVKKDTADRKKTDNVPIIPGAGFTNITEEYLKSLTKKQDK